MTRAMSALVDGLPVETLPIDDRGLQYGHGMFETAGVMWQVLIEQRPGIEFPIETRDVAVEELENADECFLTNAVIGVWPVARILERDRARLRPGRIARGIIDALEARFGFPRSQ